MFGSLGNPLSITMVHFLCLRCPFSPQAGVRVLDEGGLRVPVTCCPGPPWVLQGHLSVDKAWRRPPNAQASGFLLITAGKPETSWLKIISTIPGPSCRPGAGEPREYLACLRVTGSPLRLSRQPQDLSPQLFSALVETSRRGGKDLCALGGFSADIPRHTLLY